MIQKPNIVFIIGCARSGTTSLCKILDTATNASFLCEPNPNLNTESRERLDGKLNNPKDVLRSVLDPRIEEGLAANKIYGEKNVTLTAFIPELYELYNCKFMYVIRDGREAINSMYYWHKEMFGNFYRECKENIDLSPFARYTINNLPVESDTADYSRPRPLPDDPYYDKWSDMSLHETLCWYWSHINNYALHMLSTIPRDNWIIVDYSSPDIGSQVQSAMEFAGLDGITRNTIDTMLASRINSLIERIGNDQLVTTWRDWSDKQLEQFGDICGSTMLGLGYLSFNTRETPDYGSWWESREVDSEFFKSIFLDRVPQHTAFKDWAEGKKDIKSVCEVGCGMSSAYPIFFANKRYIGIDISQNVIDYCRENYKTENNDYMCLDFITQPWSAIFDLVFCHGTIENVYDMDMLIKRMSRHANKYIYITAFKGFFPELDEHEYKWNEQFKCYDNKLSPNHTRKLLESLGFDKVSIFPEKTNKADIPYETVIIGER